MSPDTQKVITTRCGCPSSPTVARRTTGADASRARATCSGKVIPKRVGEPRRLFGVRQPRVDQCVPLIRLVSAHDVDNKDQGVGGLDPCLGLALLAVSLLGRQH